MTHSLGRECERKMRYLGPWIKECLVVARPELGLSSLSLRNRDRLRRGKVHVNVVDAVS